MSQMVVVKIQYDNTCKDLTQFLTHGKCSLNDSSCNDFVFTEQAAQHS